MATFTPTTPLDDIGHGHKPPAPPVGGGDDGRGGGDVPNYGARLRRARLGLACGIATVCMVFISLTSAYIVRQGLPTFDGTSNTYVRDWGKTDLPWSLLGINTALLLISSVTMELARRDAARRAALAPLAAGAASRPGRLSCSERVALGIGPGGRAPRRPAGALATRRTYRGRIIPR